MKVTLQNTHFHVSRRPLVEERCPNMGLRWHNFQKRAIHFFYWDCWHAWFWTSLMRISVRVTRGRSEAVAVGCLHFNGTSMALQLHFNGTSIALPWHFNGTAKKKAFISICQEVQCLPHVVFCKCFPQIWPILCYLFKYPHGKRHIRNCVIKYVTILVFIKRVGILEPI